MIIAIFSDNFHPELSGIADSIISQAKELVQLGHQVVFFVPRYSAKNYRQAGLNKKEIDLGSGIKIKRFFSFPFPTGTRQGRLVIPMPWRWLVVKITKPDLIFTQSPYGVGLEALLAAKILKIPLVGTNHTAITEFVKYFPIKAKWFVRLNLKYFIWYYNKCRFASAPSQSVFEEIIPQGFNRPHRAISNPIDTHNFSPGQAGDAKKLKEQFKFSDQTIIYAGRLGAEKNIDVIIQAIAVAKEKFPKINLALAGIGQDEANLKKLSVQLGVEKNVKFLGMLDKPTLAKAYRAAEIFVITSASETQGMTVLQAMACQKPVIGVRARSLPEYINDDNGILVEPGDYQNLAKQISGLLSDPARMAKLGLGGLKSVQAYSPENIAKIWLEIFNQAVAKV